MPEKGSNDTSIQAFCASTDQLTKVGSLRQASNLTMWQRCSLHKANAYIALVLSHAVSGWQSASQWMPLATATASASVP